MSFACKTNFDKGRDGPAKRRCNCYTTFACVLVEDPDKLWRCRNCFTPAGHPTNAPGPEIDQWPPPYDEIVDPFHRQ